MRPRGDLIGWLLPGKQCIVAKRAPPVVTTDAAIDAAIARGKRHPVPRAEHASYDAVKDAIVVRFVVPGVAQPLVLEAPRQLFQGLGGATVDQLSQIELEGEGTGIVWPALGVAHYVPGVLAGVFGTARWMARMNGRLGGQRRTLAKARAARANGAKGGRPRKKAHRPR
jgi:hypothetical protein